MIQQVTVKLLRSDGGIEDLVLRYPRWSDPWFIEILTDPVKKYEGSDLFHCLQRLRADLEKEGTKILCNGARVDAHVSRMGRDMGGGRRVYITRLDRKAAPEDLVDTFGDAPADRVGTVAEQQRFFRQWIASVLPRELVEEAKRTPNGWVYERGRRYRGSQHVPPDTVLGVWKVNADGEIESDLILNPRYRKRKGLGALLVSLWTRLLPRW